MGDSGHFALASPFKHTPRRKSGRRRRPKLRSRGLKLKSMDANLLRAAFAEHKITKVKVGGFDVDGVLRGKYLSLDKFWSALDDGIGFCDVVFGWDMADVLYDNAKVTGSSTGYPDAHARIDTATFRVLPWEPGTACLLL